MIVTLAQFTRIRDPRIFIEAAERDKDPFLFVQPVPRRRVATQLREINAAANPVRLDAYWHDTRRVFVVQQLGPDEPPRFPT